MKKGIPKPRPRLVRDVTFAEYERNARAWKLRQIQGDDFSVTDDEVKQGFFARIDGYLLRYVG